jgi:1-acyl-sn-glycerol-3-phosphate acyltransferase
MHTWKLEPARDLGLPLKQRWRSPSRESGLIEAGFQAAWWTLVHGYLSAGHRLHLLGREHLPAEPPFVLIANHASHLDALVLTCSLNWRLRDRVFPIAAGDTFFEKTSQAAFAAGLLNALPLWRHKCGSHSLAELRDRLLQQPCVYILFPEGTRSRNGEMAPFKPGLGLLVAQTNVPVVPCHLDGTFEALPPHRRWPRLHKITLRIGEPLQFSDAPNEKVGWQEVVRSAEKAVRNVGQRNR